MVPRGFCCCTQQMYNCLPLSLVVLARSHSLRVNVCVCHCEQAVDIAYRNRFRCVYVHIVRSFIVIVVGCAKMNEMALQLERGACHLRASSIFLSLGGADENGKCIKMRLCVICSMVHVSMLHAHLVFCRPTRNELPTNSMFKCNWIFPETIQAFPIRTIS